MSCSFHSEDSLCGPVHSSGDRTVVPLQALKGDVTTYLKSLHALHLISHGRTQQLQEWELICNRGGIFNYDHADGTERLENLTVCPKHRNNLGVNWNGARQKTCKHPNHEGKKRAYLNIRRVNKPMSQQIFNIYNVTVPIGSAICNKCRLKHYREQRDKGESNNSESSSIEEDNLEADQIAEEIVPSNSEPMEISQEVQSEASYVQQGDDMPGTSDGRFHVTIVSEEELSTSSSDDAEISIWQDEKTCQHEKRLILNNTLERLGERSHSPLHSTLNTEWTDIGRTQQTYYVRKMNEIIDCALEVVAPGQQQQLWNAVKAARVDNQPSINKRKKWDDESINTILEAYLIADTWQTRQQILSLFANDFSKCVLQEMIPGLTISHIDSARLHAVTAGIGQPLEEKARTRIKLDPIKADHFIDYISQPALLQDVAYGTRKLKLDSGETILMPNVIRTAIPSRIIAQYNEFCNSTEFQPASDSTLFKILNVCSASKQKSMQGLDYIATEGAQAFDSLTEIVDDLFDTGNADEAWKKGVKDKLKVARRYLKIDFKSHIGKSDECGDHCMTYALSDEKNPDEFSSQCDHNHNLVCERCDALRDVLNDIFTQINNSDMQDQNKSRCEHDCKNKKSDIATWKSHLLRTVNQEFGKQQALQELKDDGALIVMDWAMKFMPQKFREKMTDFFGKRGVNWHVSAVITKNTNKFNVDCYVHIFESCTQNWFSVASIIENLLTNIKTNYSQLSRIYFRSDNAGCYHNAALLLSLPALGQRTGFTICRYDFSDAQSGKDICDRKIAPMKSHIKHYVNEKHDVTTAEQMKEALDSHGGITGCQFAVCQINNLKLNAKNIKLEGISLYNNFEYSNGNIRMWKAYGIGDGKVCAINSIAESLQGETGLVVVQDFTLNKNTGTISSISQREGGTNKTNLFPCGESGCYLSFSTPQEAEIHMDAGKHVKQLEQETTYDRIRKQWADKVSGIQEQQQYTVHVSSGAGEQEEGIMDRGWALKVSRKNTTMSTNVKTFLIGQFNIGVKTGRKVNPESVAKQMKTLTVDGDFQFQPSEWCTVKQISSMFSRLAAAQKQKPAGDKVTSKDEVAGSLDNDDIVSWVVTGEKETFRQHVYQEIDISHPITYGDINVCKLISQGKWKNKRIKDLSEICDNLGLEIDGPVTRKESYVKPLRGLVNKCCQK